jgi:AraC-like DNA-binding protein
MNLPKLPFETLQLTSTPLIYETKGWQWSPKPNNETILFIGLEGKVSFTCNGLEYSMEPWKAILIPPMAQLKGQGKVFKNLSARFTLDGSEPLKIMECQLRDTTLGLALINACHELSLVSDELSLQQRKWYCQQILALFWRDVHSPQLHKNDAILHQHLSRFKSGKNLFSSCEDLAQEAQMTRMHYHRSFLRLTGLSVNRYLINMRIEKAKILLRTTSASIESISSNIGYADTYFFSRQFKRFAQFTPKQYRQHYREI